MMKLLLLLTLAPLLAVAAPHRHENEQDDRYAVEPQRLRNLKSFQNGNVIQDGLLEIKTCVPFDTISDFQKANQFGIGDEACNTNTCPGGCCRSHSHALICDTRNWYPYVHCVCNENTQDPSNFVPSTIPYRPGNQLSRPNSNQGSNNDRSRNSRNKNFRGNPSMP